MNNNIAFLELKYGNIYGGYPNFYAIFDASLMIFDQSSQRIFLENWSNDLDLDVVSVYTKLDEQGIHSRRIKEVINMRSGRRKPFMEDHQLDEDLLRRAFGGLREKNKRLFSFFLRNFKKYRFDTIITFAGSRDIFLCEKANVRFDRYKIVDLQAQIKDQTNYLFSLNKLSLICNFDYDNSFLMSNNLKYWLHPIAARHIRPRSAGYDVARLLVAHQEFTEHHDDFMMKAALYVNKVENSKKITQ